MLQGLLFGLGFFLSIIVIVIVLIFLLGFIRKLKPRKAEVSIWRNYLEKVKNEEDWLEVSFITSLINSKAETDTVTLPKNYILKSELKILEESESSSGLKFKVDKWIEKKS